MTMTMTGMRGLGLCLEASASPQVGCAAMTRHPLGHRPPPAAISTSSHRVPYCLPN